jgi:hypothetical protein
MGDVGELFNAVREHRRDMRAKHGVPCPDCQAKLPRANPSILLPGQRCRIHGYRDPRPFVHLGDLK